MATPNKIKHLILMATFLVFLAPLAAFAAGAPENLPGAIGEVVYLVGTVKAEQPDGTVRTLELKKQVLQKDVIVTGMRSSVEIIFKDESVFAQGASSRVSLDDFVYTGQASGSKLLFKMGQGTFRYVTGEIVKKNPDAFALETPTTTIGIRGTEVFAAVRELAERIGNFELTAGYTMTVGPQEINQAMRAVTADPKTGTVSRPEPVSADEAREIIKAAPMTTQGEPGMSNEDVDDMANKVEAFDAAINRSKENLGTGKPVYGNLHTISMQESGQKSAERDNDKAEEAQAASENDGGGY